MSINVETGEVIVKDDAGEMKKLMADPKAEGGVDLKMLKVGDPVSVESDSNGVIKSLKGAEYNKQLEIATEGAHNVPLFFELKFFESLFPQQASPSLTLLSADQFQS